MFPQASRAVVQRNWGFLFESCKMSVLNDVTRCLRPCVRTCRERSHLIKHGPWLKWLATLRRLTMHTRISARNQLYSMVSDPKSLDREEPKSVWHKDKFNRSAVFEYHWCGNKILPAQLLSAAKYGLIRRRMMSPSSLELDVLLKRIMKVLVSIFDAHHNFPQIFAAWHFWMRYGSHFFDILLCS